MLEPEPLKLYRIKENRAMANEATGILVDFLKRTEGGSVGEANLDPKHLELKHLPADPDNVYTVGYGTTFKGPPNAKKGDALRAPGGLTIRVGDRITPAKAELWLRNRANHAYHSARREVGQQAFDQLTPNQQAAVASLVYNVGASAFGKSKSADILRNYTGKPEEWEAFAYEAYDYDRGFVKSAGKRRLGLQRRRLAERVLAHYNGNIPKDELRALWNWEAPTP